VHRNGAKIHLSQTIPGRRQPIKERRLCLEAHSHISPLFGRRQLDEYANVRHRFAVISLDQFFGKHRQPQDKVRPDSNPEKHFVQFLPRPADVLAVRSREKVKKGTSGNGQEISIRTIRSFGNTGLLALPRK
jgi:hypothetical protein